VSRQKLFPLRGASRDVVNPLLPTDKSNPVTAMPILDVDKSLTIAAVKRILSPGFAAQSVFCGNERLDALWRS
jgi:NAD/NADP transhydrogenase beta subunit